MKSYFKTSWTCGQFGFLCQILSGKFSLTSPKLENLLYFHLPSLNHSWDQEIAKERIWFWAHIHLPSLVLWTRFGKTKKLLELSGPKYMKSKQRCIVFLLFITPPPPSPSPSDVKGSRAWHGCQVWIERIWQHFLCGGRQSRLYLYLYLYLFLYLHVYLHLYLYMFCIRGMDVKSE